MIDLFDHVSVVFVFALCTCVHLHAVVNHHSLRYGSGQALERANL